MKLPPFTMHLFLALTTVAYADFVYGRCKIQVEKIQTVASFSIVSCESVKQANWVQHLLDFYSVNVCFLAVVALESCMESL